MPHEPSSVCLAELELIVAGADDAMIWLMLGGGLCVSSARMKLQLVMKMQLSWKKLME